MLISSLSRLLASPSCRINLTNLENVLHSLKSTNVHFLGAYLKVPRWVRLSEMLYWGSFAEKLVMRHIQKDIYLKSLQKSMSMHKARASRNSKVVHASGNIAESFPLMCTMSCMT